MADNLFRATQDFHRFAQAYREQFPDDVLRFRSRYPRIRMSRPSSRNWRRADSIPCWSARKVDGIDTPLITNFFASRTRIGRLFDVDASGLFDAYQQRANAPIAPVYVAHGPVLDQVY